MSSSDEEEIDILSSLVPNVEDPSSDDSDDEVENGEIQDEILSSESESEDEEESSRNKKKQKQQEKQKKQLLTKLDFPSLE